MRIPNLFVASVILALTSTAGAQNNLRIATLNCEWLIRSRVHIKFGLSFNINDADPTDVAQWAQEGFRDQRFAEACDAVGQFLAGIDADVLALTEVGRNADLTELVNSITAAGVTYPHVEACDCNDPTGQKVAVLSQFPFTIVTDRLEGRAMYDTEPGDPEEEDNTGLSKGMRVTFNAHGEAFHLFLVHLKSERGGFESDAQRLAQASIIRRHVIPLVDASEHVIVMGDLNAGRGSPTVRRIRGFDDVHGDLIQTGLRGFFDDVELDSRWTYEFMGHRQQLDHVLLSYSIRSASVGPDRITAQIPANCNALVSDHRPVVVNIRLP